MTHKNFYLGVWWMSFLRWMVSANLGLQVLRSFHQNPHMPFDPPAYSKACCCAKVLCPSPPSSCPLPRKMVDTDYRHLCQNTWKLLWPNGIRCGIAPLGQDLGYRKMDTENIAVNESRWNKEGLNMLGLSCLTLFPTAYRFPLCWNINILSYSY